MIVDHQWHWMPPESRDALLARSEPPYAEWRDGQLTVEFGPGAQVVLPPAQIGDLGEQLEAAGALGLDVVVCSPIVPAEALHLEPRAAAELLLATNEGIARGQRAHPDRFVGLATLPLQDAAVAIEVLDAAAAAGLSGVSMLASLDGAPIASESTMPVFRRIEELGMPVVLHPATRTNTSRQELGFLAEVGLGWMYQTTLAALNLIESGVLDDCPDLVVLHPHLGGVLPYVLGRLERMGHRDRPLADYLRTNFWVDTVSATPAALGLAAETYGADRILFATDHPWIPVEAGLEYVRAHAPADEAQAIFARRMPGLRYPAETAGRAGDERP